VKLLGSVVDRKGPARRFANLAQLGIPDEDPRQSTPLPKAGDLYPAVQNCCGGQFNRAAAYPARIRKRSDAITAKGMLDTLRQPSQKRIYIRSLYRLSRFAEKAGRH
jgi:hypothetical protein